nr:hypothetical protein Iba_chr14fCG5610 [Ipomoea batatas]
MEIEGRIGRERCRFEVVTTSRTRDVLFESENAGKRTSSLLGDAPARKGAAEDTQFNQSLSPNSIKKEKEREISKITDSLRRVFLCA